MTAAPDDARAAGRAAGSSQPPRSAAEPLLGFFAATYVARHDGFAGAPIHDVCAVLALTYPDLFTRRLAHVTVETDGTHTRGMTVVDLRPLKELAGRPEASTEVLMSVDQHRAFRVITDAIAAFS